MSGTNTCRRYTVSSLSVHCQFQFRIKITFQLVTLKGTKIIHNSVPLYSMILSPIQGFAWHSADYCSREKFDKVWQSLGYKDVISTLNSNSTEPNEYHIINRAQCDKNMTIRHILTPFWQYKPGWLKQTRLLLTFGRLLARMTTVTEVCRSFQTTDMTSRPVWQWPFKFLIIY